MYEADYTAPPSMKQSNFARLIAARLRKPVPDAARGDRAALSAWIDRHKAEFEEANAYQVGGGRRFGASSRQASYAEILARRRHSSVPDECYRDKRMMSRWIETNA